MDTTAVIARELLRVLSPRGDLGPDDLSPGGKHCRTRFADLGLTSLAWIDLVQRVEASLGVVLGDDLLVDESRQTVSAWSGYVDALPH